MLQMRPNCETCDRDLPADVSGAMICSFECTYCDACAIGRWRLICPNCKGQLTPRPTRVGDSLARNPASNLRVHAANGDVSD